MRVMVSSFVAWLAGQAIAGGGAGAHGASTGGRPARGRRLVALVFGLLATAAQGSAGEAEGWSAECRLGERAFRLDFAPASVDAGEEDLTASLQLPDRPALPLQLKPGNFRPRGVVATQPSACRELGAYLVQDQIHVAVPPRLLLWLSVEDRPGWDLLSLVLIDVEAGTVLDRMERLAPIKDPDGRQGLTLLVAPDHFQVRLQRLWLHGTGTDSPENSIEDWHRIEVRAGRIRARWER